MVNMKSEWFKIAIGIVLFSFITGFIFLGGRRGYKVSAVAFDGSTDYLTRGADLTGNADSKEGTISVWLKFGQDGADEYVFMADSASTRIQMRHSVAADDKIRIYGQTTAPAETLQIDNGATLQIADGWTHVLASWDLANAKTYIYINDVAAINVTTANDNEIDYTRGNFAIGGTDGGATLFLGDMADFFWHNDYIDISSTTNRRKFITGSGKPADLGPQGEAPFGSAPLVYLRVKAGAAVTTFLTNLGSGGNFTDNGSIALASTSPSD